MRAKRRDPFWRKAKREGFRSRSAFKLQQLDDRFHVLGPGRVVVDLGASPGGWSQVAVERCPGGKVVGIDLDVVKHLEGAVFLRGDFTDPALQARLRELAGQADTVLSDLSPNISGAYGADHARSVHLAEQALDFASRTLRPGGDFVVKVFEGDLFPGFVVKMEERFDWVKPSHPPATRRSSSEIYVIGKRFRGATSPRAEERAPTPQELAGRFELKL